MEVSMWDTYASSDPVYLVVQVLHFSLAQCHRLVLRPGWRGARYGRDRRGKNLQAPLLRYGGGGEVSQAGCEAGLSSRHTDKHPPGESYLKCVRTHIHTYSSLIH